jgi:prophage regulatory protein
MSKDAKIPSLENISDDSLLRVAQILRFIPVSRSHWWQGVRTGKYPPGFKLSERIHVWPGRDIKLIINNGGKAK